MRAPTASDSAVPWWKEPTRDQWMAYLAAWLGWTLDAFDFTIFLLIMVPIADEFHVPLAAVAVVFTITLWMRLVGAVASGWLADRVGHTAAEDEELVVAAAGHNDHPVPDDFAPRLMQLDQKFDFIIRKSQVGPELVNKGKWWRGGSR
jgi:hypothetical protein